MKSSLLTVLLLVFCISNNAFANPLVGEISSREIMLSTSFSGTSLMFFGARNESGDIIVVVRGPNKNAVVRKKEQVYGIWINRNKHVFENVAGFYALASARPYEDIKKSIYFDALGIGYKSAIEPFMPNLSGKLIEKPADRAEYNRALIRYMRGENLYNQEAGKIEFIGETLFKVTIPFPDSTPRGVYTAEMYLFSDGELVSTHITPIDVFKVGFDAFTYELAQSNPLIYGIIAVFIAVFSGWLAATIFRRV